MTTKELDQIRTEILELKQNLNETVCLDLGVLQENIGKLLERIGKLENQLAEGAQKNE